MKFKRSKQVKNYADVKISNPNFLERKNWDDFQKFHKEKTNEFYKVFRNEVNKHNLNYIHKNALLSLVGIPRYGGDLRVSDRTVKIKLHDFLHHGLNEHLPRQEDGYHFYFVTIVDDSWIFSFDHPVGKFYRIRDRIQRVLTDKGFFLGFGSIEVDVQKHSHLFNGKRALTGHGHLVLCLKEDIPAEEIENSLESHFNSAVTPRTVHVAKIDHDDISKIASYVSKVPPCAKLRWVQKGKRGVYSTNKPVELAPREVVRLLEIYSEMHINSLFIGIGKKGEIAKNLKQSIKTQFTQWHKDQIGRNKGHPYSSREIYISETRQTWAQIRKKYGFHDMAPSELVYVRRSKT